MRKKFNFLGKDVSKEISNLKEFLIQQGKEIVRLKQDVKVRIGGYKIKESSRNHDYSIVIFI